MMRSRRCAWIWKLLVAAALLVGCGDEPSPAPRTPAAPAARAADSLTIVAMGDSLTEGLGVAEEQAYPALLEARLRELGYDVSVINAGISGETSSGALTRVPWVLDFAPAVVILTTGANDGFRGIDPSVIHRNIDAIVDQLQRAGIVVVLGGMQMSRNLGRPYTEAFAAVYPRVARERGALLVPFFLDGVAGVPSLNQSDGIHPNAAGYRRIVETVLPSVRQALERLR
jgi:acyl-CoA thioesterase-1